jgi:hypothetical protein
MRRFSFPQWWEIKIFLKNLPQLMSTSFKKYKDFKRYKRCLFASELLRRAYCENEFDDISYKNWRKNNKIVFNKINEGVYKDAFEMGYIRKYPEEYSERMYKVITKRLKATSKNRKKEAWEYIHKHIESWWD